MEEKFLNMPTIQGLWEVKDMETPYLYILHYSDIDVGLISFLYYNENKEKAQEKDLKKPHDILWKMLKPLLIQKEV